jgi:hypothetical protein
VRLKCQLTPHTTSQCCGVLLYSIDVDAVGLFHFTIRSYTQVLPQRVLTLAETVDVLRWYMSWIKKSMHRTAYRSVAFTLYVTIQFVTLL